MNVKVFYYGVSVLRLGYKMIWLLNEIVLVFDIENYNFSVLNGHFFANKSSHNKNIILIDNKRKATQEVNLHILCSSSWISQFLGSCKPVKRLPVSRERDKPESAASSSSSPSSWWLVLALLELLPS